MVKNASKSELTRKYVAKHPSASPKEIVDGLKAAGVEVSVALASKIKYNPSRKGRRKKKIAASKNGSAKYGNKAEAIRSVAKSLGKKVRPRDIIATLGQQGITVTSAQVSTTLKKTGMRPAKRGKKRIAAAITVDNLIAAKKLVEEVGSVDAASAALSALAKLS